MRKNWKVKSIALLTAAGLFLGSFVGTPVSVMADEPTEETAVLPDEEELSGAGGVQ